MPSFARLRVLPLFLCVLSVLSCEQVVVTTLDVDRVDVSPATSFVRKSEATRLSVTVLSRDGRALTGRTVEWSSLQPAIATVDETGMVRGLAPGTATIRATSEGVPGTASVTVTAGPAIAVTPAEVDFAAVQNGASPGDKTVAVANAGDGTLNGLTATIRYGAGQPTGWLSASLPATAPATLVLSATQAGLSIGTYTASVEIASPAAENSPVAVTVRLAVLAPQPAIALGATAVAFNAAEGGGNPAEQGVGVTNAGGGSLTGLTASVTYGSGQPVGWLTASFAANTAPTTLLLRATTGSLPQGVYSAQVQVSAPIAQNSPQLVNVTFAVGPSVPVMRVSPPTLRFTAAKTGANPADSTVQITNIGGGTLDGLAVSVSYPGGQASGWLVATLNGTTAPATVTVGARTGTLDVGTYTASVSVTSPAATNSPQRIDVTFEVQQPPPMLAATPTSVSFAMSTLTGDPAPATVAITNTGGGTLGGLTRSIAYGVGEPEGWLTADLSGTTAPATLTLAARSGVLLPGTYNAKVQVASPQAGNAAVDIVVTFNIPATAPISPGAPTATAISDRRIDVSWQDRSHNESRFDIERSLDGTTWSGAGSVPGNQSIFSDGLGLVGSTTYHYRVSACNAVGCALNNTTATATTAPVAPSGLNGTPTSATTIDLRWSDNSPDETGFGLERSADGGQTWGAIHSTGPNVTGHTDASVNGTSTYRYRVRACRNALCSGFSNEVVVAPPVAPSAPANLAATALSSTQVALRWQKPAQPVTGYRIERSTAGGGFTSIGSTADTAFNDANNVQPSTTYEYRVQACFTTLCSPYSNVASVQTPAPPQPPAAPTGLAATAVATDRIDLAWSAASGTVNNYIVERKTTLTGSYAPIATLPGTTLSLQNTGLTPSTVYYYRVQACNTVGCSPFSNEASATTLTPPPQPPGSPSGLTALTVASDRIVVSWSAATGTVTHYVVERRTASGSFAAVANVPGTSLSHSDGSLQPATEYFYRVQACNTIGCSGYSNEASATTQPLNQPPGAPSGLQANAVSSTAIDLAWGAASGTVTSYSIERKTTQSGTFVTIASVSGSTLSFQNTGLAAGTEYVYRVAACNASGCSGFSNEAAATTHVVTVVAPPNGLSASAVSASQINIAWSHSDVLPATGFDIERALSTAPSSFTLVHTAAGTARSFSDTGLTAGTTYLYRVRACNITGCSVWAGPVSATTTSPPGVPTGVSATAISSTQVTVQWTAPGGQAYYEIRRRVGGSGQPTILTVGSATATSFTDSGLAARTSYSYEVRACAPNGTCSGYSGAATAITP